MKIMKKTSYIILVITLLFSLFACNYDAVCKEHKDSDSDGVCDVCKEKLEAEGGADKITLVDGGEAKFQIVKAPSLPISAAKAIDDFVKQLKDAGIELNVAEDKASSEEDCEILVGNIKNRDEKYTLDMYTLGKEGYVIKAVDEKIIISSGDYNTLGEIFSKFLSEHLGIDKDSTAEELQSLSVTRELSVEEIQTNYRITGIKVNGGDIRESFFAVEDDAAPEILQAAKNFQDVLYDRCGIYLDILDPDELTEDELSRAIVVRETDNAGSGGFRITVKEQSLIVETEFRNKIVEIVDKFLSTEISPKRGEISFSKIFSFTENVRNIYYNDFGAAADGKTCDMEALAAAHEYANKYGHTVCAGDSSGKTAYTYYIGKSGAKNITVKTDVKWGDARFIIDDSIIAATDVERKTTVFHFKSDYNKKSLGAEEIASITNEAGGIDKTATKLNYEPGFPALLIFYNDNKKQYIRYGANENSGDSQHEVILIDGEGNIDKDTPFLFDYDAVTRLVVIRADDKPIKVTGGKFTTIANRAERKYDYYSRNLTIERSNVTFDGLFHEVTGEGDTGAPYTGFINFRNANNLLVQNATLQAHKTYVEIEAPYTNMGTYDISGGEANGLYFKNCTQSNFFLEGSDEKVDTSVWGIMGTNYCKNITYDASRLSRLDAHAGVYNASIINGSEVQSISLIGGGTATITNSKLYCGGTVINLRNDYGSLWQGEIYVDGLEIYAQARYDGVKQISLVNVTYNNHNFGYPISFGTKITFRNISVPDTSDPKILLFSDPTKSGDFDFTAERVPVASKGDTDADKNGLYKNLNPITMPTEINLIGFDEFRKSFSVSTDKFLEEKYKNSINFTEK